jgi:pimeloyl-ACP methyl ester carboxylesterase
MSPVDVSTPVVTAFAVLSTTTQAVAAHTISPFQPVSCGVSFPEGLRVTCGDLTVPEDRSQPNGQAITLRVAILHSQSAQPLPDPILVLDGGPASSTVDMTWYWAKAFGDALSQRDVIVFDQRGSGYSRPSLACPEVFEPYYGSLANPINTTKTPQSSDALHSCHERLVKMGINLAAYTTTASAADVNDLRLALGYKTWNLYGISYGTRLALTVLRDDPEGVRSVILDSTVPLEVDFFAPRAVSAERAFNLLFARCRSDEACNQAYPDLESLFYDLANRLDANPITISVIRPLTGQTYPILLTGDRMVNYFYGLLYSTDAIPNLPHLIYELQDNRTDEYAAQLTGILFSGDAMSLGAYYSIVCAEEAPFTSIETIQSSNSKVRQRIQTAVDPSAAFANCATWNVPSAPAIENMPVSSDIPALILAGEFDPITPPAWGKQVAENLPNARFIEFTGVGHGVLGQGVLNFKCSYDILDAFLANPSVQPDSQCASSYKLNFWTK